MLVLLAALCPGSGVHAGNDRQLVALINDLRQSSTGCGGRPVEPVAPLAPDERLARVRVASEAQLQAALRQAGYRAAKVQVIAVSGPRDAATALRAIKQRYCRELLSAQFAEIGVLRLANSWQVVLARPLSFASLGDWQAVGRAVLAQVNQARAAPRRCGERAFTAAPALTWDARLAKAALLHSRDMAEHDYFSHRGRDGSYADLRATRQGYRWRRIGENLAAGQNSVEQVVAGWLSSPEHCANIMNPRFTEMGAAYVLNPKSSGGSYWAQLFGTPR
ncbi:CAP domain-containing protein [Pseudomonas zhanjiangensis]|uniref:CAP domain-containing protein n=1 Tax=Pseudomonas zhanjiangensis TaxID=3239015 RepID=UPI003F69C5A4